MTITSPANDSGRTDLPAWAPGWLGGPVIGIANGALRRAEYEKPLGDPANGGPAGPAARNRDPRCPTR